MDMPFGIFTIYGVLTLPEFLAYDWSIFSCLKPLVTKLEVLCGDMTGPLGLDVYGHSEKVKSIFSYQFIVLAEFVKIQLIAGNDY